MHGTMNVKKKNVKNTDRSLLHKYILNTSAKILYMNFNINTTVNSMLSHSVCTL